MKILSDREGRAEDSYFLGSHVMSGRARIADE
jgi:hypothetical protein